MFARGCVSLAGSLLMGSPAIAAPADSPLQPIKPWNVDYGETRCTAAREYGSAADPIVLAIRPAPNGETYELLVGLDRGGPRLAEELEGSVDFGRGPISAWLLRYGGDKSKLITNQFRIRAAEMAQARFAAAVVFHINGRPDVGFRLSNMTALLKGLEDCTADLKAYWHMDGKGVSKVAVPSTADLHRIFNDNDYPEAAISRFQAGKAQFLLLIDEKGEVAGCHVAQASGVPALDAMGCQVIRERAKFKPALDANGKPVRSTYGTPTIIWQIEG